MSNQEILAKAIEKAVANGWEDGLVLDSIPPIYTATCLNCGLGSSTTQPEWEDHPVTHYHAGLDYWEKRLAGQASQNGGSKDE